MQSDATDAGVAAAADYAVGMVQHGMRVGLGSGRAATAFIERLGRRIAPDFRVTGVATSEQSAAVARAVGIPLLDLARQPIELALTVDGADEVGPLPELDLIKGWGGALVRERIVAAASLRQIIVIGPEKLVRHLGDRGRIPVEVIPMARWIAMQGIKDLGLEPTLRMTPPGQPFVTDNGNFILDCAPSAALDGAANARALERELLDLVGVVDTGLFLGTATEVLIGHADGHVEVQRRDTTHGSTR